VVEANHRPQILGRRRCTMAAMICVGGCGTLAAMAVVRMEAVPVETAAPAFQHHAGRGRHVLESFPTESPRPPEPERPLKPAPKHVFYVQHTATTQASAVGTDAKRAYVLAPRCRK